MTGHFPLSTLQDDEKDQEKSWQLSRLLKISQLPFFRVEHFHQFFFFSFLIKLGNDTRNNTLHTQSSDRLEPHPVIL